jgi:hypothetical protein
MKGCFFTYVASVTAKSISAPILASDRAFFNFIKIWFTSVKRNLWNIKQVYGKSHSKMWVSWWDTSNDYRTDSKINNSLRVLIVENTGSSNHEIARKTQGHRLRRVFQVFTGFDYIDLVHVLPTNSFKTYVKATFIQDCREVQRKDKYSMKREIMCGWMGFACMFALTFLESFFIPEAFEEEAPAPTVAAIQMTAIPDASCRPLIEKRLVE